MTRKIISLLAIGLLAFSLQPINLHAQQTEYLKGRFFQFAAFAPLQSGGQQATHIRYRFSLSLLHHNCGAVDGMQLGGLVSYKKLYARGFQLSGLANVVGQESKGFQMAGLYNYNGSYTEGFQLSGGINNTAGQLKGMQIAVIMNNNHALVDGLVLAGIFNRNVGSLEGLQTAGLGNVLKGNSKAVQLSGLFNVADTLNGIQMCGLINKVDVMTGLQIAGLLNIADSVAGTPIALVSIVQKSGFRQWQFMINELWGVELNYLLGVRHFYTGFSMGIRPSETPYYTVGYSLGRELWQLRNNTLHLQFDLRKYLQSQHHFSEHSEVYSVGLDYHRHFFDDKTLIVRLKFALAHWETDETAMPAWRKNYGNYQSWPGLSLGLGF